MSVIKDQPFDSSKVELPPSNPEVIRVTRLVAVKLDVLEMGGTRDGKTIDKDTPCPNTSDSFGLLPAVAQYQLPLYLGGNLASHDCYILAEATITGGNYTGTECHVSSMSGARGNYATCNVQPDDSEVQKDWMSSLALEFTSEVLKCTVMQNYSQPWASHNLTEYTTGMLTLGYHAAWSGLVNTIGRAREPISFRPIESVVRVEIDMNKL